MSIDPNTVNDGDTVTIEDRQGNKLTGVVFDNYGSKGVRFRSIVFDIDSSALMIVEHTPKPKLWKTAPDGSLGKTTLGAVIIKRGGTWYYYGTPDIVHENFLDQMVFLKEVDPE